MNRILRPFVSVGLIAAVAAPALASFHLMQIEQVIGGVNGDPTAQAIQLRMRIGGQNLVQQAKVMVRDAAGNNPVLIVDMAASVPVGTAGARVLIASPSFISTYTTPPAVANFTMTNLIPASYLAAGSLTFESDGGVIYWRLSWGGASYTGTNTGNPTNDADSNFGPPFAGPLPSSSLVALRFTGAAGAGSTNNAADYALSASPAVFVNNAGSSFTVSVPPPPTGACCFPDGSCSVQTGDDCSTAAGAYQGNGTVCSPNPCRGACCIAGVCSLVTVFDVGACAAGGGSFLGFGTDCTGGPCTCPGDKGDANCSGAVDFFDIDPFLQALFDLPGYSAVFCGGSICAVDVDCSGVIDFFDIDPFLTCLFAACPPCP